MTIFNLVIIPIENTITTYSLSSRDYYQTVVYLSLAGLPNFSIVSFLPANQAMIMQQAQAIATRNKQAERSMRHEP